MRGEPDHQQCRPPFRDELFDYRKTGAVIRGRYRGERMSEPGFEVADRDADALRAEIERENGARSRVRGEGRGVRNGQIFAWALVQTGLLLTPHS